MTTQSTTSPSHEALMLRYIDGDRRAFDGLVRRLGPKLRRYLGRRVHDPVLVDDLLQQTYVRIHGSRARYLEAPSTEPGSVEAWFMTAAHRVVLDYMRREYRRQARVDRLALGQDTAGFGAPLPPETPEQQLAWAEQQEQLAEVVRSAVGALPEGARTVVLRHKLEGQSMQQIANDLGIAAGTIRVRAHRAYRRLADALAPLVAEPA